MSELISRDALLKSFMEATPYGCGTVGIKFVDDLIKQQPTVLTMGDECYIIPKNGVWEVNGVDIHKLINRLSPAEPEIKFVDERYSLKAYYCPACGGYVRNTNTRKDIILEEELYCGVCGTEFDWTNIFKEKEQ